MVSQDLGSVGIPHRGCGTMQVHHRMLDTNPQYAEARRRIEDQAFRTTILQSAQRTGCTKIPVVVHVVHNTDEENISDEQINSQIEVLNQDFRKKNSDIGSVPAPFTSLTADARIEYELATQDPVGNPTTGITRTRTTLEGFETDDGVKFASQGGVDAWPRDRYLNIWVCQLRGGLLGYAQFPGGAAETDGVVVTHTAFGTTGTAAAPFNKGRTTTHEIGHWLNLRHIWGDDGDGCGGSDLVSDTPNQGGPNYGTPAFPSVSCSNGPNGDMFMNYMDYVDDEAMMMFTQGQVDRMHAALDGARNAIGVSMPCETDVKVPPKDNPKEFTKESPKELPKDSPKEFTKDQPKEVFKEFPKDSPKEFTKDGPKDSPFDPPKTFLEPPVDFPFSPTQPLQPTLPGSFAQQPFVLATPFNRGNDQRAQLAAAYLQLLTQYAQLHAQGRLDSQALNAWQQVWSAYGSLMA